MIWFWATASCQESCPGHDISSDPHVTKSFSAQYSTIILSKSSHLIISYWKHIISFMPQEFDVRKNNIFWFTWILFQTARGWINGNNHPTASMNIFRLSICSKSERAISLVHLPRFGMRYLDSWLKKRAISGKKWSVILWIIWILYLLPVHHSKLRPVAQGHAWQRYKNQGKIRAVFRLCGYGYRVTIVHLTLSLCDISEKQKISTNHLTC